MLKSERFAPGRQAVGYVAPRGGSIPLKIESLDLDEVAVLVPKEWIPSPPATYFRYARQAVGLCCTSGVGTEAES